MISDAHKFIYIHPPKCGGMSLTHHFLPYSEDIISGSQGRSNDSIMVRRPQDVDHRYFGLRYMHANALELRSFLGQEKFQEYYKFASIRNTYERLISLYFWSGRAESINAPVSISRFKHMIGVGGLNGREQVDYPAGKIKHARSNVPLNFFVCDEENNLIVDRVFEISNAAEEVVGIFEHLAGVDYVALPDKRKNAGTHRHYSFYYTDEMRQLVDTIYEAEITKFNFKFERENKDD